MNSKQNANGDSVASNGLLVCDHDFEWVDESYDHEFGAEQCGHYECKECGEVDGDRNYEYEPMPDDVMQQTNAQNHRRKAGH